MPEWRNGRRGGLKIHCWQQRGGSSPFSGIHKKNDEWLSAHNNVFFHFTPTSASWLNQVEIWFNIMSRKVLRGASFDNTQQLCDAIRKYIDAYNETAGPFVWKKREVRGTQIKDTIANL